MAAECVLPPATSIGFVPFLSAMVLSAPALSSARTTSRWPRRAAHNSGVDPPCTRDARARDIVSKESGREARGGRFSLSDSRLGAARSPRGSRDPKRARPSSVGGALSLSREGAGGRERERARRARGGGGARTSFRWLICAPAAINSSATATWPSRAATNSAVPLACARAGGRIGGAGGGVTSVQFSLVRDPLPRAPRGGWCVCVEVWARMDQPRRRDRAAAERSAESAPPRRTRADGQNHFSAKPGSS